jgi:RNA polymerase sigma-70 factor (ECF subfamily)
LSPQSINELADDLSYALLLALERLSALERASFILHDVFDFPFSDIAEMLARSEPAIRQLATRARKAVREGRPSHPAAPETHKRLLLAFMAALSEGDATRLKSLLREDAVYMSDSGGHKPAASRPVLGADRIVRLLTGLARRYPSRKESVSVVQQLLNGSEGLLIYVDGVLDQMLTISVDQEKIVAVYVIGNPEKLSILTIAK